jgi:hypothetical protein
MEEQIKQKSKDTELVLLGIDKVWIKTENGHWRDKAEVELERQQMLMKVNEPEISEKSPRSWWQFWK